MYMHYETETVREKIIARVKVRYVKEVSIDELHEELHEDAT